MLRKRSIYLALSVPTTGVAGRLLSRISRSSRQSEAPAKGTCQSARCPPNSRKIESTAKIIERNQGDLRTLVNADMAMFAPRGRCDPLTRSINDTCSLALRHARTHRRRSGTKAGTYRRTSRKP